MDSKDYIEHKLDSIISNSKDIDSKLDKLTTIVENNREGIIESKIDRVIDNMDDGSRIENKLDDIISKFNEKKELNDISSKLDQVIDNSDMGEVKSRLDSLSDNLEKSNELSKRLDEALVNRDNDEINSKLDRISSSLAEISENRELGDVKAKLNDIISDINDLKAEEVSNKSEIDSIRSVVAEGSDFTGMLDKLNAIDSAVSDDSKLDSISNKLDNMESVLYNQPSLDEVSAKLDGVEDASSKIDDVLTILNDDSKLSEISSKLVDIDSAVSETSELKGVSSKLDRAIGILKNSSKTDDINIRLDNVEAILSDDSKIDSLGSQLNDVRTIVSDNSKLDDINVKLDSAIGILNDHSKSESTDAKVIDSDFKIDDSRLEAIDGKLDSAIAALSDDSRLDDVLTILRDDSKGDRSSEFASLNTKLDSIDSRVSDDSKLDDAISRLDGISSTLENRDRANWFSSKLDNILLAVNNGSDGSKIDGLEERIDRLTDSLKAQPASEEVESKLDKILRIVNDDGALEAIESNERFNEIESKIDDILLNLTENTTDLDIDAKLRIISHKFEEFMKEDEASKRDEDEKVEEEASTTEDEKRDDLEFDPQSFESEIISIMEEKEKEKAEKEEDEKLEEKKEEEKEEEETPDENLPVKVEAEIVSEPESDPEEEMIVDIARSEYTVKKKRQNFNVTSIKEGDVSPVILVLTDKSEDEEKLKGILSEMGADSVNFSDDNKAMDYIKNNDVDMILVDVDSGFDPIGFLDEIVLFNIPALLIVDIDNDIPDELFNYSYNFIFKPFTSMEVEQTIYVVLIEHTKNHQKVLDAKNNIDEKNRELVIEKIESFLLLFISVTLIVTGIVTFNLTFLQWIVFIPSVLMLFIAVVSLKKIEEPEPFEEPPFVSIIIPAHNEEHSIEGTVRCIGDIDYTVDGRKNYELIVCNDGSTDRTGEILKELKDEIDVLRIVTRKPPQSGKGKGFVLNDALNLSNGEIIGVFDADTRVHPDFLDVIIPYLNNPTVDGVQSRVKMYNKDENFVTRMQHVEFTCFANTLRARDIMGFNGFLGGNGQFIKKDAINDVGKWDGFAVTEDLNISIKMLVQGKRIRFCGEAAIYQEAVNSWKALFKQRTRWASGNFEALFIYTPVILRSKLSLFKKLGIMDHISFYAFNLFIFAGFVIFIANMIAWFVFHQPTFIRMEAPLIIGIISAFAFFPPLIIALTRDKTNIVSFIKDLIGYWIYCYHLIPLFFKTMYSMFTRKERTWDKTEHVLGECETDIKIDDI